MSIQRLIAIASIIPLIAFAHTGEPLQPEDLWSAWTFNAGLTLPLTVSAVLYALGSRKHFGLTGLQKGCFWAGWLSLAIALLSPLHPLGEVLFSAHMVQHEILMIIAAPLLVVSRPLVTFLWALPMKWRRHLGHWSKTRAVRSSWLFLTAPLAAWWIHALAIWLWHAPPLFEATLTSDLIHAAQHLSFFASALLFWWALVYAHGRRTYGSGVLYIFTTAIHTGILGALLTFSPHLWYPTYTTTTQAWGLSSLEDQQIGGLIMWVPASLVYLIAGLVLLAVWIKESDALLKRTTNAE
ncbi:MAG: cytochrome c oxidase assembly protein [Acidobacteriaceae bacterium]|nr:cytochrome c oxidase assembly protein [Acidobacteriaceae bacterium]